MSYSSRCTSFPLGVLLAVHAVLLLHLLELLLLVLGADLRKHTVTAARHERGTSREELCSMAPTRGDALHTTKLST